MSSKARIFIASTKEALDLAHAVFAELADEFSPEPWDTADSSPNSYTLEILESAAQSIDYAVLILSPEDMQTSRGDTRPSPRDNLVFELGFFIGVLGMKKVFAILPDKGDVKLPSDFYGVNFLKYYSESESARASVRTACGKIKTAIRRDRKKTRNAQDLWPLQVAIVSADDQGTARLSAELLKYSEILEVETYKDLNSAREAMRKGMIRAAFVDLFTLEGGIELIAYARDRHREIGFAIFGTRQELFELPGISGFWRKNLWHFWNLAKDSDDPSFSITVEDTVLLFFLYALTSGKFGEEPGQLALHIMRPGFADVWPLDLKR